MTVAREGRPLEFDSIEEVTEALRRAGHRVTMPTRAVLEALFASDVPMSAERLAAEADAPLELPTVYRNLERLEQLGAVRHLHAGHGPGLYALTGGGDRDYLACERCGRVTVVEPERLDALRAELRDAYGYEVRFSHFPMVGLCERCARASRPARR
jgi:Fur family transcriptional regulator, ferric uptake regulator